MGSLVHPLCSLCSTGAKSWCLSELLGDYVHAVRRSAFAAGQRPHVHACRADSLVEEEGPDRQGPGEGEPPRSADVFFKARGIGEKLDALFLMFAQLLRDFHQLLAHLLRQVHFAWLEEQCQLSRRRNLWSQTRGFGRLEFHYLLSSFLALLLLLGRRLLGFCHGFRCFFRQPWLLGVCLPLWRDTFRLDFAAALRRLCGR